MTDEIIKTQAGRIARLEQALLTVVGLSYSVTYIFNGEELSPNALLAQEASCTSIREYAHGVLLEELI